MSNSQKTPPLILGIDPGLTVAGYGLLEIDSGKPLDWGCIHLPKTALLSEKLKILYESLEHLCQKFPIAEIGVESQFVHQNAMSALKLGIAKGIAVLIASKKNLPVYEYTPTRVKKLLTGNGRATKVAMQQILIRQFAIDPKHLPSDAADALAVALCHRSQMRSKIKPPIPI